MMLREIVSILIGGGKSEQKAPSLDDVLDAMDRKIGKLETFVESAPESKPRTSFNSGLPREKMALAMLPARQKLRILPKAVPLMLNMSRGAAMYTGKVKARHTNATPELIAELEGLAYKAGVKDIRYVRVPRNAIFQGKGIPHQYAIVFTVEMDKEPINTSPSFESQLEVMRGYKNLAIIGNKLARFLQKRGYAAYPGTALGGATDYVYLGELAGLGAVGYHGLLITPGEGARLRISTVYTNIENLPVQEENEHLWVRDFCAMCRKCVRSCPVDAIFDEPVPRGDGGMQCIDHKTCRDYFTQNFGCAVCLAVCPFSQVGYEKVQQRFKGNPSAPQFRIPVEAIPVRD